MAGRTSCIISLCHGSLVFTEAFEAFMSPADTLQYIYSAWMFLFAVDLYFLQHPKNSFAHFCIITVATYSTLVNSVCTLCAVLLSSHVEMALSSIKSFTLELDGPADAAFVGGEVVSGQVVLELCRATRVHSMKVLGRGVATAHWLENRGMNSVYNDYTSKVTYFRKRQHLIRG